MSEARSRGVSWDAFFVRSWNRARRRASPQLPRRGALPQPASLGFRPCSVPPRHASGRQPSRSAEGRSTGAVQELSTDGSPCVAGLPLRRIEKRSCRAALSMRELVWSWSVGELAERRPLPSPSDGCQERVASAGGPLRLAPCASDSQTDSSAVRFCCRPVHGGLPFWFQVAPLSSSTSTGDGGGERALGMSGPFPRLASLARGTGRAEDRHTHRPRSRWEWAMRSGPHTTAARFSAGPSPRCLSSRRTPDRRRVLRTFPFVEKEGKCRARVDASQPPAHQRRTTCQRQGEGSPLRHRCALLRHETPPGHGFAASVRGGATLLPIPLGF